MGGLSMKKTIIMFSIAATAFVAYSCSKDAPETSDAGVPITIEVTSPEFDEPDTKISFNGSNLKYKFDAGEYFHLFSYKADGSITTDWGRFTTDAGGAWARFHGQMPSGYSSATHGDQFRAFFHPTEYLDMAWNSSRYELKYNIPATQDGTGLKYCFFCNSNDPTFDPTVLGDNGNPKLTLQFRCYNCLCHLNLVGGDVRTIKVTVNHMIKDNFMLVSSGDKKDIVFNVGSRALSGGGNKTVTISRGGEVLSGDIFFVTRQTNGTATNGYARLTFEFINGNGEVCTKHVNLATGLNPDGTATAYKNLSNYHRITNFGTVDLSSATFVAP